VSAAAARASVQNAKADVQREAIKRTCSPGEIKTGTSVSEVWPSGSLPVLLTSSSPFP
jgi:hypothetical protein